MNVGLFQVQIFFRVSLKKVAFSSLALSQAAFFLIQYSCKRKFSDQSIMLAAPAMQQQDCPRDYRLASVIQPHLLPQSARWPTAPIPGQNSCDTQSTRAAQLVEPFVQAL